MNLSSNLQLRWAATAGIAVLMVLIALRWNGAERANSDATALLPSAPPSAEQEVEASIDPSEPAASPAAAASGSADAAAAPITVDVIGAVTSPGVYRLPPAGRVDDAVRAAGGLAPDADRERINLAAVVEDGAQIRVPRVDDPARDTPVPTTASGPAQAADAALVDINAADAAALETLPGIGPATAEAIVAYRTAHGPFRAIDDLQQVKGVGPGLWTRIRDLISVGR